MMTFLDFWKEEKKGRIANFNSRSKYKYYDFVEGDRCIALLN